MKLIIISGRSGSGKSTALHALEDEGFNCIDNFPATMLPTLIEHSLKTAPHRNLAVCIDARNNPAELGNFQDHLNAIDPSVEREVVFIDAISATLIKRFSETRRRHPLTDTAVDLREAIDAERDALANISEAADLLIDSSTLSARDMVDLMRNRVVARSSSGISLLFRSFGFRNGVPVDADFVFDLRCLPNPFWVEGLRELTGLDQPVIDFLNAEAEVDEMFNDIQNLLESWLPRFDANRRTYITVGVGCTGGQHRSVYMAQRLADHFQPTYRHVLVRHRERHHD